MIEEQLSSGESVRHAAPAALIHDLRSPLNQILGYSDLLMEQVKEAGCENFLPDLQKVHAAGQALLTLIDENLYPTPTGGSVSDSKVLVSDIGKPEDKVLESDSVGDLDFSVSNRSVLVVDDIEANRDLLTRMLKRQGYKVSTAENGHDALAMLEGNSFDLVLLDVMMPVMDGYEALRRIKSAPILKHIPVIMISALSELDSVALCIEMGAEDYLTKPFNPTLLRARIGACLEKKIAHDRETNLFDQLKENFKRLQQLERQRDDLTNMIIHDLRTPLSSLISGMQTLDVVGGLNSEQQEMVNISIDGGKTLLSMINDLLDVEKLESGSMNLDYAELTVCDLVASAVAQIDSLIKDKQLTLVTQVAVDLPQMLADEGKLRRTLVNLIGNAIKFTPSGGTLTVEARETRDKTSVQFAVSDTGEGIPAEAFERIFEKFGQVETRQAGRTMSTGLGLTFCKLAVLAHGGHIGVESKPGMGSKFWFTIPF